MPPGLGGIGQWPSCSGLLLDAEGTSSTWQWSCPAAPLRGRMQPSGSVPSGQEVAAEPQGAVLPCSPSMGGIPLERMWIGGKRSMVLQPEEHHCLLQGAAPPHPFILPPLPLSPALCLSEPAFLEPLWADVVGVALTPAADYGHPGYSHCHSLSGNGPCALRVLRQVKLNWGSVHECWSLEQVMDGCLLRAGCGGSVLCPWGSSTESQPGCSVGSWDCP